MAAIKPKRATFKKVEAEWYDYHQTLQEIVQLEEEIMNPYNEDPDENTGGGKSSFISSPTENIATRLITSNQLNYLKTIAGAIDKVYNALPSEYKQLVRVKYWSKNNELQWAGIAAKCNISRATAFRRRNEIIQATIEVLGWR